MSRRVLLTGVLVSLTCLFVGWHLGRNAVASRPLPKHPITFKSSEPDNPSLLDQKIAEAVFLTAVIEYLDSNRVEDGKYLLNLRQGSDVLMINDLIGSANEASRATAMRLLSRIAEHRAEVPFKYGGALDQPDTNVMEELNSILKKYR